MMTKVNLTGIHKVRFTLAGGKIAHYHRVGRGKGAKTFWKSTSGTPEGGIDYMKAYNDVALGLKASSGGKFKDVIRAYLHSPKFSKLKARSKKDIENSIHHEKGILAEFGNAPMAAFDDPRIKHRAIKWRDTKWGMTRQADQKMSNLRAIISWANNNGLLLHHHLKGIENVYKSDRSEIIWTDAEIAEFCSSAVPRHVQRILIVVSETGLAPVDAVRLSIKEHVKATPEGRRIEMRRAKTNQISSMPVTPLMDEVLDEMADGQELVLTQENGRRWGHEDILGSRVSKWRDQIGLRKEIRLYDARGTAATRLLNAGAELHEIALAMGWSIATASKMIGVYAKVNPDITDGILAKINAVQNV